MTRRRLFLTAALFAAGAALVACGPGFSEAEPTSAIFERAPWSDSEMLSYDFKQRTHLYGRCDWSTQVDHAAGSTELRQSCIDADVGLYLDERTAIVDSVTLDPISSTRVITNNEDKTVETKHATYPSDRLTATFLSVSGNEEFSATRDLPQPSIDVPEPAWYDDNSLMWLARGIDFSGKDKLLFTDANPSTVTVFNVEMIIEGREQIKVPAGTFETWRVRLKTKTVNHRVWVDVEAPYRVVRAEADNGTYELTAVE